MGKKASIENINQYFTIGKNEAIINIETVDKIFFCVNHLLHKELEFPQMDLEFFMSKLYKPNTIISNKEAHIKHEENPQTTLILRETTNIGYIIFEKEIIGIATANTITNPLANMHYYSDISFFEEINQGNTQIIKGKESLEKFNNPLPHIDHRMMDVYLNEKGRKSAVEGNFLYMFKEQFPSLIIKPWPKPEELTDVANFEDYSFYY